MSEIIHKTEPIKHWIVYGKAYRMATADDVGKECLRSDISFEQAVRNGTPLVLRKYNQGAAKPFDSGIEWRYAFIEDDSLLAPQDDTDIEPGPTAEAKPIDWTKPVRTKDGRAVRVLCTDGPDPIHSVVGFIDDNRIPQTWTLNGCFCTKEPSNNDLENAPQRITREYWVNVYATCLGSHHDTKEDADYHATGERLACVKITIDCEEGEGL